MAQPELITLWHPATQAEVDALSESSWIPWPRATHATTLGASYHRENAIAAARSLIAAGETNAYVLAFDVDKGATRADRPASSQIEIAHDDMLRLGERTSGVVREELEYRRPVTPETLDRTQRIMGIQIPAQWRAILSAGPWLHKGWMLNGTFLWIFDPEEMVDVLDAWGDENLRHHPGILIIGSDGASEQLALNTNLTSSPVFLVNIVSEGWQSAFVQAPDIAAFAPTIEAGSFAFSFK